MRSLYFVFLLLMALPLSAQHSASPGSDQIRLMALENAWNQAVQQKDRIALDMLIGPELVYVDYDGKLMDRAEYLASVQSAELHPERIVNEAMNVHIYGAAAVVNGVYRENGTKNGKPYSLRERFTDTWLRHGESWVCVASHSTLTDQ
jgi:ketosteroid isomerase-like protein